MDHTAPSDVHVGREMFSIFNDLFALETDQSEWTLAEAQARGLGPADSMPGDPPFSCWIIGRSGNPEGGTWGQGQLGG